MISENLHDFLLASVGASASFIGLLFVALTLVMGRIQEGVSLAARERSLAASSYTALITVFFISMVGLIPGSNVAWAMVAMGWLGMGSAAQLARAQRGIKVRDGATVTSSLIFIYLALALFGLYTALWHHGKINDGIFFTIIFILYATALGRAWTLIGVENDANEPGPNSKARVRDKRGTRA